MPWYEADEGEFVDFATLDDWKDRDEAKDAEIARLTAALAEAEARTAELIAAAYEAAGLEIEQGPRLSACDGATITNDVAEEIRALTPADAAAALDQIKAEAEARGYARAVEDAAIICEALNDKRLSGGSGDFIASLASQRIRALAQKEAGE